MDDEFGPDFVPSPAQKAHADQQLARVREAVEKLTNAVDLGDRNCHVSVGLLVADAVVEMARRDDEETAVAMALAAVAICLLAESRAHPLLPLGGETRQIWRVHNLASGGSSVHWTREAANAALTLLTASSPWDPEPAAHQLETTEQATYPDGTVVTLPWREVTDDPA